MPTQGRYKVVNFHASNTQAPLEPDAVPNGRVVDETTVQQLRGEERDA